MIYRSTEMVEQERGLLGKPLNLMTRYLRVSFAQFLQCSAVFLVAEFVI